MLSGKNSERKENAALKIASVLTIIVAQMCEDEVAVARGDSEIVSRGSKSS